jgi:ribosomal protein L37AE/L43A
MDVDILKVDEKIREIFEKERERLPEYKERLGYFKISLEKCSLDLSIKKKIQSECKNLETKIHNAEGDKMLNFYLLDVIAILDEYKKILEKPRKISFFGKSDSRDFNKDNLVKKYVNCAKKYVNLEELISSDETMRETVEAAKWSCTECGNQKDYEIIERHIYICENCGHQTETMGNSTSYKDASRVNISSKYTYERRIHFRDCINQYQAKQNSTIPQKVYDELVEQFSSHGLLVNSATQEVRFGNITKDHILIFLKELGYTKHYEDVFLIHSKLTGSKPDDISHLEERLMTDFDILSTLYDDKFKHTKRIDRKNFINTQYVLYQLLRKHRYQCRKDDFNILKTLDRKSFHDEICGELFAELGWNFTPFF